MLNIAVLASTRGTSLQGILDEIKTGTLPVNLTCVISNKADCYALERTKQAGFDAIYLDRSGKNRTEYDRK
jgi:phosphoribosylglycinamide formyltransferase-1